MTNRIFLPADAEILPDGLTVRLTDGTTLPKRVFVAVPITVSAKETVKKITQSATPLFMDLLSGQLIGSIIPSKKSSTPAQKSTGEYDLSGFSRYVDVKDLVNKLADVVTTTEKSVESDPGYFEGPSTKMPVEEVPTIKTVPETNTSKLTPNYTLGDMLSYGRIPQSLKDLGTMTSIELVKRLQWLALNVLEKVNAKNPNIVEGVSGYSDAPVKFTLDSALASRSTAVDDPAHWYGQAIVITINGTNTDAYKKVVDLALKLRFGRITLGYHSTGPTTIKVFAGTNVPTDRSLRTTYDGFTVSDTKLIHMATSDDALNDLGEDTTYDFATDAHLQDDDYTAIGEMLLNNPKLFGGVNAAAELAKMFGFSANPFLSGGAGSSPNAGTVGTLSSSSLGKLASSVTCPDKTQSDDDVFPVVSHAAHRTLSDVTQMDDKSNQTSIPFTVRANNPLKVKKVPGVTDLKTRFGYLGEVDGFAVYRDRIGGAAAGLNFLMTTSSGSTIGSAASSMLSEVFKKPAAGQAASSPIDSSALSPSKIFTSISSALFGVSDPTGVISGCSTMTTDDKEKMVTTAAAIARVNAASDVNPVTKDEWLSAYQIAKNEPNGDITKTTTGVDLPAQEIKDTQDTGTRTPGQGSEVAHTTDTQARDEKWNPVSNFNYFSSNVWGSSGSNWISQGIVSYEQKESATDKKMAKKHANTTMTQNTIFTSTNEPLNYKL